MFLKRITIIFCLCLLCVGSIGQEQASQKAISYVEILYPWSEPVEVCYIIPADGKKIIKISSGYDKAIYFVPSIKEILAKHGYEIKDINIMIHNHLWPSSFSDKDIIIYWYLRSNGFNGLYMLKTPRGVFYYDPGE